jgi:hypothetical protein
MKDHGQGDVDDFIIVIDSNVGLRHTTTNIHRQRPSLCFASQIEL